MKLDVKRDEDRETLELVDHVERRQVSLRFPAAVSPVPVDPGEFVYPVDRAVSVRTDTLVVEPCDLVTVFDATGAVETHVAAEAGVTELPAGDYLFSVSSHVKTYLAVEADAPVEIEVDVDGSLPVARIDFGSPRPVRIGVRSVHEHPAATVTTTRAPTDVMAAVSALGSALKDLGPDRSFPSLRGHPPAIELGETLDVPDSLGMPDTGVTIQVPRAYASIFPVAPLVYYLGAALVPGDRPLLRTDGGFEVDLDGPGGFERTIERILKQVFACDCYVRSAGPFAFELDRLDAFVAETGLEPEALYDRPLAEQLEAYLSVPYHDIEPFVPEWGVAAHLEAMPGSVEYLPYLVNDLAVIRSPESRWTAPFAPGALGGPGGTEDGPATDDGFFRGTTAAAPATIGHRPARPAEPRTPLVSGQRSVHEGSIEPWPFFAWPDSPPFVVRPAPLEAQEQLWIADGIPLGADRPRLDAYRRSLDREPVDEIEIVVVCNDDRMAEETEAVRDLLGAGTSFDVRVRPFTNVTTDELRTLLEMGGDVLHFIGHIDDRGFACADGVLDATSLGHVDVDVLFLNACRSYDQGEALIDAGAIAAAVTLEDVLNRDAVRAGRTVTRLLSVGFPLNSALRMAADDHGLREKYTVLGDGQVQVTQAASHAQLVTIDPTARDDAGVRFRAPVTPESPIGSVYSPTVDAVEALALVGEPVEAPLTLADLGRSLDRTAMPVLMGGHLEWAGEIAGRLAAIQGYRDRLDEVDRLVTDRFGRSDPDRDRTADSSLLDLLDQLEAVGSTLDLGDYRFLYESGVGEGSGGGEP